MGSILDDSEEIEALFSEERNPHGTLQVARLIFIIDRRPSLLYEQCEDLGEEVEEVDEEVDEMASRRNGTQTEKLCSECGKNPIKGNRSTKCHSCSRKSWEGRQGVGGRLAAQLETRFQMERKQFRDEAKAEIRALKKEHEKLLKQMRSSVAGAQARAESAEKQATVLQFLSRLAEEEADGEFCRVFRNKLELAVKLAREGWSKEEA